MTKHIKPTVDELEANALANAEEAEKILKEEEQKEEDEVKKIEEKADEIIDEDLKEDAEEAKEQKESEDAVDEDEVVEEVTPPKPIDPDYKRKFIENQKQNIILNAKAEQKEKLDKAIDEVAQIKDIPEDVIKKDYPEWDDMTQTEQRLARENYINNKRFEAIHQASLVGKDIEIWNNKVDAFLGDPKTLADIPELDGRTDDFKVFAMQSSRRNVDFDTLVAAFLYDATKTPKKKGKMFEEGTGGDNEKPKIKSNKITMEQARQLRYANYPKYKELLKAGMIESIEE